MPEEKTLSDYSPKEIEKARQTVLRRNIYHQEHKEEQKLRNRKHYQNHKAEKGEYNRQYHNQNKAKQVEYDRRHYQEHRDEILEQRRQHHQEYPEQSIKYNQEHKDKIAKQHNQYHRTHQEKILEYHRRNHLEHKKERYEYHHQHDKEHPEVPKASHQKRRATLLGLNSHFTAKEFKLLCEVYENRCFYCKQKLVLGPDHVVPLSRGGSNNIDNIVPACKSCNSRKHDKTLDEYVTQLENEEGRSD